jgi:LPXTG-motif cell wall-anchored protein
MKLRRALVTVATTAAIAPAALMAAPAAFAADPSAPPTPSVSPAPDTSSAPAPAVPPASSAPSVPASTPPKAPPKTLPSTIPSGKPSPAPSKPAAKDPWDSSCAKADIDANSVMRMSLSGLPSKIVAGSGWHQFTLTAANPTKQSLGEVRWVAVVDNEKETLPQHTRIEYFNGKTWVNVAQQLGAGIAFGQTSLGAYQKVDIQLRVSVDAKAPAGRSFTVGVGGYLDAAKSCTHTSFATYLFTTLAAGSDAGHPAPAKPKPSVKPPTQIKTQEGGATPLPATGTVAHSGALAHTGASSALPALVGVSGAAIVAGAGAIFVVRRRKAGSAA